MYRQEAFGHGRAADPTPVGRGLPILLVSGGGARALALGRADGAQLSAERRARRRCLLSAAAAGAEGLGGDEGAQARVGDGGAGSEADEELRSSAAALVGWSECFLRRIATIAGRPAYAVFLFIFYGSSRMRLTGPKLWRRRRTAAACTLT
jgi:hypothetical protein